jgi:hypothetical protein
MLKRLMLVAAAIGMAHTAAASPAAAEEQTIEAFSVWHARGQLFKTGENIGTFVGALRGRFFVDTPEGPVEAGTIVCPGTLEVDLEDASQSGQGRCVITSEKDAQVFASWTCSGYHLIGCSGEFTLTGGTGKFSGVTGGGPFTLRSTIHGIAASAKAVSVVEEASIGVAHWKALRYKLP